MPLLVLNGTENTQLTTLLKSKDKTEENGRRILLNFRDVAKKRKRMREIEIE